MKGELSTAIDKSYDSEPPSDYRSSRMGASTIGHVCEAFLAFTIRGFPDLPHPAFLKRIFRDGHKIETDVLRDLKKAGFHVQEVDPMTGKQYMWESHGGHICYYADGIIDLHGEPILLEVKSMNDALFTTFMNKGVKISHKKYYQQMQIGMGLSGFTKCVIIAYNKNKSRYWDETIEFDPIEYSSLIYKGERVLKGEAQKIATDPTDWRCKDCSKCQVCWFNAPVVEDMRTCANAYPSDKGWSCEFGCEEKCMNYERYKPLDRK